MDCHNCGHPEAKHTGEKSWCSLGDCACQKFVTPTEGINRALAAENARLREQMASMLASICHLEAALWSNGVSLDFYCDCDHCSRVKDARHTRENLALQRQESRRTL